MWLKYQQVNAKMASFDPREMVKTKDDSAMKHPLKRFEPTLRTTLRVVVPMNLDRLKKHKANIEKYARIKNFKDLHVEQINATRTVQQLQATIRDLNQVKAQIQHEDINEFVKTVTPMQKEAMQGIDEFVTVQTLLSKEVEESILKGKATEESLHCSGSSSDKLVDDWMQDKETFSEQLMSDQVHCLFDKEVHRDEIAACQSWDQLRNGLVDLNSLVQDFATVVHNQQETVDRIEDNIEQASESVQSAATFLGQASKYKAVVFPVTGAIIGGVIGGPIGLLAGFKLAGIAAAVGGGVVGYQGGKYMKKKHDERVDLELQNLKLEDEHKKLT